MQYPQATKVQEIVGNAQKIVILQADNPDGDSLASALALEQILHELGKDPLLYCGVDVPTYLRYLPGWDRVSKELPHAFDASIIIDASTMTLFEKLVKQQYQGWVASKPCIVLDHHDVLQNEIPFASVTINDPGRASTGELIYFIAKQLGWPLPLPSKEFIMTSILGDTQGLANSLAGAETYRVMAELVEAGVDRPALEERRREFTKMPPPIFLYKARLIDRTVLHAEGKIATVSIPQEEINEFSPLYNPAPLIQTDMLQVEGVGVAIVFKRYDDGKVTAAIRCNPGYTIGAQLAEHFGGGGHPYASGFKVADKRPPGELETECIKVATELIAKLEENGSGESLQHPTEITPGI